MFIFPFFFFFYCPFSFEPNLSRPAILSDFLPLLLLSTIAAVGGGGQESVPVAYGFPLC